MQDITNDVLHARFYEPNTIKLNCCGATLRSIAIHLILDQRNPHSFLGIADEVELTTGIKQKSRIRDRIFPK